MISNGFMYWIFFALCKLLYGVIPGLYDAFEFFGTYQFFDLDKDIKTIWGNLYVLLSVLVLFAIAIKLINAIVNPDVLDDKKNGVKKVFIKAFVAVFLTVLTPYMFTLLVDVQENIFTNKTIDKLFFNASGNQNTGHVIAWTAITSFINLDELAEVTSTTNHAYNLDTSAVSEGSTSNSHIYILSEDIDVGLNNIYKSQPWNHVDSVHQNPILMLLAGAFIVYEFILLVMDTALRSIKLGILQMMTPVILGAYIFKEDILKRWALEYIKTFVQIFLLLISISLMTKVLSLLPNIMAGPNWPNNPSWLLIGIINTLAIIATLRLVHQIVPLINKIFGTNIESKGGIRGRLGEMAVVGGLAQRAWDSFRQNPARALTAPVSAVGGFASHMTAVGARARSIAEREGGTRGALMGAGALAAGFLTSGGAIVRGARQGWTNGNLRSIGAQYSRYNDTHLPDSTLGGRLADTATSALGLGTREERQLERDKLIEHRDPISGQVRRMTFEELQARQNVNKGFDDVRAAIRSQVETSIDRESSKVTMAYTDETGARRTGAHFEFRTATGNRVTATLNGNAASVRKQLEAITNASVDELRSTYGIETASDKAQLIAGLNASYAYARNQILDQAENAVWSRGTTATYNGGEVLVAGADKAIVGNNLDHATDLVNDNADLAALLARGHDDGNGHITTSTVTMVNGQVRITDFRNGSRLNVSDEYNSINRDVNRHNDEIAARQSTNRGREQHASGQSVNARNNNNGGNTGGNNH